MTATRLIALAAMLTLAACAGTPNSSALKGPVRAEPVAETPAPSPADVQIEAAPIAPDTTCEDAGDGIGGTGCSVD